MARQFARSYSADHIVNDDGSVDFRCSQDTGAWPWLTLGPQHPVVIQAQNFWTSVGAIMALGGMEEGQWSALTWTDWQCGDPLAGMAVRGLYSREKTGETESYRIILFDDQSREIATMRGRGVVFRNRNFEEWRGKAKNKVSKLAEPAQFAFAPRDALGIGASEHALIGPAGGGDGSAITALVSRENALPPANPMLGGSGDHVNSVHMIEAARQALCLIAGTPNIAVTGGEMELNRYVELGAPFDLTFEQTSPGAARFALTQFSRECAAISLNWRAA